MRRTSLTHTIVPMAGISLLGWQSVPVLGQGTRAVRLEAGTVIPVRLDRTLNSKDNRKGDHFTATLKTDLDDYNGLPSGTVVDGIVQKVKSKQGDQPGQIDLAFQSLRLPNGRSYAIEGSVIGLDNKSVERRSDGVIIAKKSARNNRLTYVGYGAGAGLLVSLLSGGKIKLENILLGGGLGYLFGSLEKNRPEPHDVSLKAGTEMGVRLDRNVRLTGLGREDRAERDRDNSYDNRDEQPERDRFHRRDEDQTGNRLDRRRGENNTVERDSRDRADATDIGVLIEDRDVHFASTARPIMMNNIVMIPVRPVLDAARVAYSYDNGKQSIQTRGERSARMTVGSRIAVVNGKRIRLDAVARKLNGTMYVPAKFLEIATGQHVSWDASSRTIVITGRDE